MLLALDMSTTTRYPRINPEMATDWPLPMVSRNTHIKTFGDNKVSVMTKILNYPV